MEYFSRRLNKHAAVCDKQTRRPLQVCTTLKDGEGWCCLNSAVSSLNFERTCSLAIKIKNPNPVIAFIRNQESFRANLSNVWRRIEKSTVEAAIFVRCCRRPRNYLYRMGSITNSDNLVTGEHKNISRRFFLHQTSNGRKVSKTGKSVDGLVCDCNSSYSMVVLVNHK